MTCSVIGHRGASAAFPENTLAAFAGAADLGADWVELDGAGRVMLPPRYLQHAGITGREVMVAGAGDSLELWDRDRWETYYADLKGRATDLTASLGHPA